MVFPDPPWTRTGPGSALTYGKNPQEQYGKIFLLCVDYYSSVTPSYRFFKANTYFEYQGSLPQLSWEELTPPPPDAVTPQPDAAICYLYNPISSEEKVLAVFAGQRYVWAYDVPMDMWRPEREIWGNDPVGPGASMEFGGFRVRNGNKT